MGEFDKDTKTSESTGAQLACEDPDSTFDPCDDPMTPMVEDCRTPGGPYAPPAHQFGSASRATESAPPGPLPTPYSVYACYYTDWYESYDYGVTWHYTDSTLDYCQWE